MNTPNFVVVVGTSAGGMNALTEFVSGLRKEIDAAIFIVMHLSGKGISDFLVHRLQPHSSLPCVIADEDSAIKKGTIYIAPPNFHLLLKKGSIILGPGPEENRWRPSIDVLFRSAAVAYNTRVIGVVLTGLLDDGTAGMMAIKRCGGTCIVQDPNEAEYPDMPLAVLNNTEVDYSVPLAGMADLILQITQSPPEEKAVPEDVLIESEIAERVVVDYENVKRIGEKSIYACPDCGGGLWELTKGEEHSNLVRYRCHIGHLYSEKDLVIKQGEILEATLWTALRIMEERRNLLKKLESDHARKGLAKMAESYAEKAESIQVQVDQMKAVLFESQKKI